MAACDNVKLRLGFLNNQGQQKGVDSLIVTDMIELARNHAMSDAVIVSGDEDVRVGVQVAQVYGVRVHLVGIHPARGSQSRALMHEADTTVEWDRPLVSSFLSVIERNVQHLATPVSSAEGPHTAETPTDIGTLREIAAAFLASLPASQREDLAQHFSRDSTLPGPFDRVLLAHARARLARRLEGAEKIDLRAIVRSIALGLP